LKSRRWKKYSCITTNNQQEKLHEQKSVFERNKKECIGSHHLDGYYQPSDFVNHVGI